MSYLTSESKTKYFSDFGGNEKNTGSIEAQVAILTEKINHISQHLSSNKKDWQ